MIRKALMVMALSLVAGLAANALADEIVLNGDFTGQSDSGGWLVSPWSDGGFQFQSWDLFDARGNYAYTDMTGVTFAQANNNYPPGITLAENTQYDLSADLACWTDNTPGETVTAQAALFGFNGSWIPLVNVEKVHNAWEPVANWEHFTGSFSIPAGGSWAGKEALVVLRGWKSSASILARAQMDNVSLISSTIPEPASMATMILGLAGALVLRRRMR